VFYCWDITIPKDTEEDDPVTQTLKLSKGVITRLDVKFPAGCHGMVGIRITRYEAPLVPLARESWLTGDDETVPTEGYYELFEAPSQLKFVGCSPDTDYPHTISVRVQVLPKEVVGLKAIFDLLYGFFKRLGVIR